MRRTTSQTDLRDNTAVLAGGATTTTGFARAYDQLVAAWRRHDDVRHDPTRVPELAEARQALDQARSAMAATRVI